ncbi:MAG: DUF3738 domain-containing protein [Elusimicrobiales bacterium]|nr:DUF3738 domain-containing protein [Elusimicrobiales bacterium]
MPGDFEPPDLAAMLRRVPSLRGRLPGDSGDAADARPVIEVRVSPAPGEGFYSAGRRVSGAGLEAELRGVDLCRAMSEAYGISVHRIEAASGFPRQRFDFFLRVPGGSESAMRCLLIAAADAAFGAESRLVKKKRPALLLRRAGGGDRSGLRATKGTRLSLETRKGGFSATCASAGDIAAILEEEFLSPVEDETGLAGRYDACLAWTPGDKISLARALGEDLGLELADGVREISVLEVERAR